MNLLIVEDREDLRKMLTVHAQSRGWLVLEAGDLGEAFEWLNDGAVDAILCDGEFPLGEAALRGELPHEDAWLAIAYRVADEKIPFALLSGDVPTVERAEAIGVSGAFHKPDGLTAALDFLERTVMPGPGVDGGEPPENFSAPGC